MNLKLPSDIPVFYLLIAILVLCPADWAAACQDDNPFGQDEPVRKAPDWIKKDQPEKKEKEQPAADEGPVTDTKTIPSQGPQIPDQYVRFHMWDGTIVAGEVQIDRISIKTEFGVLEVPIQQIRKLFPGLDSIPEMKAKIESLVERLGDKDFDIREKSHRELASMGMMIRNEIDNFEDGGSAERKKRLSTIKQQITEELDEFDEEDLIADRSMIRGDAVETPEFEIVGKILQETFTVKSKFGQLTVDLSDIKMAERSFEKKKEAIKKNVAVGGQKFFQRQPVSTRIRVNRGDKISIKADGIVQWTNWSSSSTPAGLGNQGVYQGIKSGTLCARIGSSGKIIKVGTKSEWTAKQNGILYLGIAMQDNYLNNTGYRWTGEYNAKVQVKPADSD